MSHDTQTHAPQSKEQTPPSPNTASVATAVATRPPLKSRGYLHVPVRSSSRDVQPSPTTTGLSSATATGNATGATATGATATGVATGVSRETVTAGRSSFLGRRRNGSVASSKKSQSGSGSGTAPGTGTAPAAKSTTASPATSQPSSPAMASQHRRRKGGGGFLSIFGCCSVPEEASGPDGDEQALPTNKLKDLPLRPATASRRSATAGSAAAGNDATASTSAAAARLPPQLDEKTGGEPFPNDTKADGDQAHPLETQQSRQQHMPSGAPGAKDKRSSGADQSSTAPSTAVASGDADSKRTSSQAGTANGSTPTVAVAPTVNEQDADADEDPDADADAAAGDSDTETTDVVTSAQGAQILTQMPEAPLPPPPPGPAPTGALPIPKKRKKNKKEKKTVAELVEEHRQKSLLPPIEPHLKGRKCLVLDLDETLVHSSFKILHQADFTIPVEIEGNYHNIYVIKRPGVDEFMKRVGELYEVVVFTASVSKYGDPLLDQLDIHNVVHHRLFRESCFNHQGNYVKDLSMIGRDLKDTIIIDNSPTSYIFHPEHAVPISSWFSDAHDNELMDLVPVLEDLAGPTVDDVSMVLDVML